METNATRREGATLIWELDGKQVAAFEAAEHPEVLRVRYKL